MTLSKDPSYTDEFTLKISGVNSSNTFSPPISNADFQTQSSGWSGTTPRTYSVTKSFSISTADVGVNDVKLAVQAISAQNYLIGTGANTVAINRVADAPVCVSDVYLQNTSSLSGTKSAGQSLYAGRAVTTTTTNGDVVIVSGVTVAFVARDKVMLDDGFSVQAGANFSAFIDGSVCSSGLRDENPASVQGIATAYTQPLTLLRGESSSSKNQEKLNLYPNPATDEINLLLPDDGNDRELPIYNSFGREVKRIILQPGQSKIDVRALKPGIYYIHTMSKEGIVKTRFSVER